MDVVKYWNKKWKQFLVMGVYILQLRWFKSMGYLKHIFSYLRQTFTWKRFPTINDDYIVEAKYMAFTVKYL